MARLEHLSFEEKSDGVMTMFKSLSAIVLGLMLAACQPREDRTQRFSAPIAFAAPAVVKLPASSGRAKKRGFGDFNCDGIEDMLEIKKTSVFKRKYRVRIFLGDDANGILQFKNDFIHMDLPTHLAWYSSNTKIDIGDINGDGCTDVIFSQYVQGYR